VQWVCALRVLVVRMDWHVIMQVSNAVTRSECRIYLGTRRALAGNEQVGMRAPASEQGRRGGCMATPADRMHTATVLGARSNSQQRGRGAYAYGPNGVSSRKREISRHAAQQKSTGTPMKCEAAVAIQASNGLALVSVSRQHAPSSLVRVLLGVSLRVEFLLKTESGYLRDAEVSFFQRSHTQNKKKSLARKL